MRAEQEARARAIVDKARVPLAPGDPRRHHFIPQFYLRRFADERDRLAVVRFGEPCVPHLAHVKNVAVVRDLYTTIDEEVGETVAVERILARADDEACRVIEGIALGTSFPPDVLDRGHFAGWLGLLYVRDPQSRRRMEALADQAFKLNFSLAREPEVARARLRGEDAKEPSESDVQELIQLAGDLDDIEITPHQNDLVKIMLDSGVEIGRLLLDRHILLLRFPEPGLLLSDRPIVLYQRPGSRSPFSGVGPANADEIWLPLDRRTILVLHRDAELGDFTIDVPTSRQIDGFNQAIVAGAASELYCHPADLGRLEQLQLPDANQPLVHVSGVEWLAVQSDGVNAAPVRKPHRRYRRLDAQDVAEE